MKRLKILIVLSLIAYCMSLDASAKPTLSSLNCKSDSTKYSTLCEKYWLSKIPKIAKRLSNKKLQVQVGAKKQIILEDEEICTCDCVWTHNYLAGYYPKIGYLFYLTWFFDWNQKTNSYFIPTKDFTTDHGDYFLIDLNSGARVDGLSASLQVSPNNKRLIAFSNEETGSYLQILEKNNKSIDIEHKIDFHIGKVENVHWINNNKLSFTRTFQKEKLPSRNVTLVLSKENLYEEKENKLFPFEDIRLGQNLIEFCASSKNTKKCLFEREIETIAQINVKEHNLITSVQRKGKRLLFHFADRSMIFDPDLAEGKIEEYQILDKFDNNFLIRQKSHNQQIEYLILDSIKAKLYKFSSIPKNIVSPRYIVDNSKAFQIFNSLTNKEISWISENNIEKYFGQNYHLIHRQANRDILFSAAYDKYCETQKYILNWIGDQYVLAHYDENLIVHKWNLDHSENNAYKKCSGSLNELRCYKLVEQELIDFDNKRVSRKGKVITLELSNDKKITLSPWIWSKDQYFYLGMKKNKEVPSDKPSSYYLVAKLSNNGKVQYLFIPKN